ncbi:hypothetical protein CEP52_002863 [Fusarium oligoseptatum]|uniref:Uncharacterized protein n=1 Tax=Fusarium oligoseptatum TaxID=2604345 RepID=A0A428UBI0_9HYPO|nr:hypothetical protein CEP52_002863 [Fusarium oligoseptatum]
MTSDNCTCPLAEYQMTVVDNGKPIDTMTNMAKGLGYSIRGRKNEPEFAKIARAYPSRFTSRAGIPGHQLVKWSNYLHQQGLVEMTHKFLCTDENGPRFWPDGHDDDRLRYSEHRDEIFEEMFRLFFTINQYQKPKKPRLKRSRRDLEDHEQLLNADSVDGQPPTREVPTRGEMPRRPTKSPDELHENSQDQNSFLNNPRRRVSHRRDYRGNPIFNYSPRGQGRASAGPSRRREDETTRGLTERPRSPENATMTDAPTQPNVEMDNTTHNGVDNGPPQPANIARASEAPRGPEDQEGPAYDNRAFWPSSGQSREVPQSRQGLTRRSHGPNSQPAEQPASPRPEPKTNPTPAPAVIHGVHLIISVQTFPWLNEIWHPHRNFFRYTLKTLFEELPWQGEFYTVIMLLEFPGGVVLEEVQRDDEMSFRVVLARFEQKIETLRMCYTTPGRDIVLEVSLEPMGRYQEPSERVRALLKRHMR